MKKEFVLHEEALALRELGFDVGCLAFYDEKGIMHGTMLENPVTKKDYPSLLQAPLYQQAFMWFREKYGLTHYIDSTKIDCNCPVLRSYGDISLGHIGNEFSFRYIFNTYEEAELACLKKLIEIVKKK